MEKIRRARYRYTYEGKEVETAYWTETQALLLPDNKIKLDEKEFEI